MGEKFRTPSNPPKVAPAKLEAVMHTYTATGQHVPIDAGKLLGEHKFSLNQIVASKKYPEEKRRLVVMGDPVVVEADDGEKHQFSIDKFLATWAPYEEENYAMADVNCAPGNHNFQVVVAKANIYMAMDTLSKAIGMPSVRMQSKPARKVFSKSELESGALVLVPETTNITMSVPTQDNQKPDPPSNGVLVEGYLCKASPAASFYLMPPSSAKPASDKPKDAQLQSAFWCVRSSTDETEVNMVRGVRKVTFTMKSEIKKGNVNVELNFPVILNNKSLSEGDELVILKETKDDEADKQAKPKAKGHGKGKSKGELAPKKQRRGS